MNPDDWKQWRALRLQALTDAPSAFGSSLEDAQRFEEVDWRERLSDRAIFAAFSGGDTARQAVGVVGAMQGEDPACCELVSMWVRPDARGHGVGDALVQAVLSWSGEHGYRHVLLWVTEGNWAAARLYERLGFAATGQRQPVVPGDTSRLEIEMIRPLAPNSGLAGGDG
jgi:ribosomal protein S18 acetylase RimI-like enzyme